MEVFVHDGLVLMPICLKIILNMQILRAGERIVYKIRIGHVLQKAIPGVTWNRLPQLSGQSENTVHKTTAKKKN
jgi:hypothetical protein